MASANPNTGIWEFIQKFCAPEICSDRILRGDQRSAVLPKEGDFITFTPISTKRLSKTSASIERAKNSTTYQEKTEVVYQIDCYGDNSYVRAVVLENMAQSDVANTLLNRHGIESLYTSPIQNLSGALDDEQITERWMFTFTIGVCNKVELPMDYFTEVKPALIEINAHFRNDK